MAAGEKLQDYKNEIRPLSASQIILWAAKKFGPQQIIFASSLGIEDQVLTDMHMTLNSGIPVMTLDTGRLPQETYTLMDATREFYGMNFRVYFPGSLDVEAMESECGPNLFYESVEKRKHCCRVRKIDPLRRALAGLSAWISGLRREQSENRSGIEKIEWDNTFGLYKINPLADWTEKEVWSYVRKHRIPYNALHDRGYPTIGCAPCTRAVQAGEDFRAGRWWWESSKKECGIHETYITGDEQSQ